MSNLIGRLFEIRINGEVFIERAEGRQFRVLFEILHDFGGINSYADITLVNLTEATGSRAMKKGDVIEFIAGYRGSVDVIFRGVINYTHRLKPGSTETGTRVIARSGKLTEDRAIVNKSFGAGVSVIDLIKAIASALELPLVADESDLAKLKAYPRGYSLSGDPVQQLDKLAEAHKFSYLVENERLIIVANGSYRRGRVHLISQSTGMEGVPEITEVGADVTIRLDPRVKVGSRFKIESEFKGLNFSNVYFQDIPETVGTGEYVTQRVAFSGDSHGDVWSAKLTGLTPGKM